MKRSVTEDKILLANRYKHICVFNKFGNVLDAKTTLCTEFALKAIKLPMCTDRTTKVINLPITTDCLLKVINLTFNSIIQNNSFVMGTRCIYLFQSSYAIRPRC